MISSGILLLLFSCSWSLWLGKSASVQSSFNQSKCTRLAAAAAATSLRFFPLLLLLLLLPSELILFSHIQSSIPLETFFSFSFFPSSSKLLLIMAVRLTDSVFYIFFQTFFVWREISKLFIKWRAASTAMAIRVRGVDLKADDKSNSSPPLQNIICQHF